MRQPEKAAIRVPVLVRSCVVWSKRNANEPPGGLFTLHTSRQSAASAHLIRSLFRLYTIDGDMLHVFTILLLCTPICPCPISDLSGDRTGVRDSACVQVAYYLLDLKITHCVMEAFRCSRRSSTVY